MEEKIVSPDQPTNQPESSNELDSMPVSSYSLGSENYPLESLEVKNEEGATPDPMLAASKSKNKRQSMPFSRKKATLISLGITIIVVLATAVSLAQVIRRSAADQDSVERNIPTQSVEVADGDEEGDIRLEGSDLSLLVGTDIITKGDLKVVSGGFFTSIRSANLNADQTITLPGESGTLCLDSNNCNFAEEADIADLEGRVVQLAAGGVQTINGQTGDLVFQGSINRVSVVRSGNVVTVTTPQDLHASANVQFGSLTLAQGGSLVADSLRRTASGSNLTIDAMSGNVVIIDDSRTFTFPSGGAAAQTICTTQNNCNYGTGNGDIVNGGQIGPIVIGTNDASSLAFKTNNTTRIDIQAGGNIAMDTDTLFVDAANSRVGVGTASPSAKLQVQNGSVLVQGTPNGGNGITITSAGSRMFFDVNKSAFRAGIITSTSPDSIIGEWSTALGYNAIATNTGSMSFGVASGAFGAYSLATNFDTQAVGSGSQAFGYSTVARAYASTAIGKCNSSPVSSSAGTWVATDQLFVIGNSDQYAGSDCTSRYNALEILKNGHTSLNGSLLVQKTATSDSGITVTGPGTRMFFDVAKGAFRAGDTTNQFWDGINVGNYSAAFNRGNLASGNSSTGFGHGTRASGDFSFSSGVYSRASGHRTFAAGVDTNAQAYGSAVFGRCNIAQGAQTTWVNTDQLFVIGNGDKVSDSPDTCATNSNALELLKNGNLTVDNGTLFVDAINNRIGIGDTTPEVALDVAGSARVSERLQIGVSVPSGNCAGLLGSYYACDVALDVMNVSTESVSPTIGIRANTSISANATNTATNSGLDSTLQLQGTQNYTGSNVGLSVGAASATSGTVSNLYGLRAVVSTFSGTTANAVAMSGVVSNISGAIQNGYGLVIESAGALAGTITNNYGIAIWNQTVGTTSNYGLYIQGASTYSLWVDSGATRLDGTLEVGSLGMSDTDIVLCRNSLNQLAACSSGVPPSSTSFLQGGNSFGATATLGTLDGNDLELITNGITRLAIDSDGITTINGPLDVQGLGINTSGFLRVGGVASVGSNVPGGGAASNIALLVSHTFDSSVDCGGFCAGNYNTVEVEDAMNSDSVSVFAAALQASGSSSIGSAYGLAVANPQLSGTATITNNYGLHVMNQTAGTNDYGLYVEGADTYAIWADNGITRLDGSLQVSSGAAGNIGAVVQSVFGQTASLQQWQNDSGDRLLSVEANGDLFTDRWLGHASNTFLGVGVVGAGNLTHTVDEEGRNNVAIGAEAMYSNTTGNANATVGAYSMHSNTTGAFNSALGNSSLHANTTGSYNTASGFASLYNSTDGSFNSAYGSSSMLENTTGSQNTAMGSSSLYENTTGNNNTAIGYESLFDNTTGSGSVSIGHQSLSWTNGSQNTAIGYRAGFGVDSNSAVVGNTLLGYEAGYGLQTGADYNVLVGYQAGNSLTTGANNILIGRGVNASSGSVSNYLRIGNYLEGDLVGGTEVGAAFKVTAPSSSSIALIVQGASSQTANLQQWQSSSGAILASIGSTGGLSVSEASVTNGLAVDTDTLFVDATNHRVGIGTSTPGTDLEIASTSAQALRVTGAATDRLGISLNNTDTGANNWLLQSVGSANTLGPDDNGGSLASGSFIIKAAGSGNTNALVMDPWGKVGLGGVNVPTSTLQVRGTAGFISSNLPATSTGFYVSATGTNDADSRVFDVQTAFNSRLSVNANTGFVGVNNALAGNQLSLNTLVAADATAQLAVATGGAPNKGILVQGASGQSADLFQAQDYTGAVLASISSSGALTVTTATINGTLTVNGNAIISGHIISGNSSGSTTIVAGPAADCSTSGSVALSGNDTAGTITIGTGTSCATGVLATITLANSYGAAPRVILTPKDANGATLQYFNGTTTTTSFTVDSGTAPADSTTYTYNYHIIE